MFGVCVSAFGSAVEGGWVKVWAEIYMTLNVVSLLEGVQALWRSLFFGKLVSTLWSTPGAREKGSSF